MIAPIEVTIPTSVDETQPLIDVTNVTESAVQTTVAFRCGGNGREYSYRGL